MKIDHGGTEITEKTREKLKLRALRVSVVNDFPRSRRTGIPTERRFCACWGKVQPARDLLSTTIAPPKLQHYFPALAIAKSAIDFTVS
jgi:hypothetical protein